MSGTQRERRFDWIAFLIVTALPFVILAPFANKAFHIDDTVYLMVAEQIQNEPLNFFGFDINWNGTAEPVFEFNRNPPGFSYVLAVFFAIFGWGEIPIHLAMALIASVTAAGTYLLADRLSPRPFLASLVACLSPALLVSSNTVMTDVPMVACYVWGVFCWIRGLDLKQNRMLVLSGAFIGAGILMKYFCVTAIPLLAAYTLARERKLHQSLYYLLIPVFILGGYVIYSMAAYGVNLVSSAADFSVGFERDEAPNSLPLRLLVGFIFAGGSVLSALLYGPALWRARGLAICGAGALALFVFSVIRGGDAYFTQDPSGGRDWIVIIHMAIFLFGGAHLLGLVIVQSIKRKDEESLLLFLWVIGTFIFSAAVNWTVSARTMLPMVFPVGILVARQFDDVRDWYGTRERIVYGAPALVAACVSIAILWGDYVWANSQRWAAKEILAQSEGYEKTYYYKGHWGFQWYMDRMGFSAFDSLNTKATIGDRIIYPSNNFAPGAFNPDVARAIEGMDITIPPGFGVTVMHRDARAGFYTHFWGPLPYAFGPTPGERYWVMQIGDYRGME